MEKTVQLEANKVYHIYTRGNNRENIFRSKENYFYFLQLYKKYVSPYADTFAYCLLPNHLHFLIRIKDEDALKAPAAQHKPEKLISVQRQMSHLLNAYAKAFNIQYNRADRLFQHRFKRKEVASEAYFTRLVYYIHFNPQHHGLMNDFADWPYSSYHSILSDKATDLQRSKVLDWFGDRELFIEFHHENQIEFAELQMVLDETEI